MRIKEEIDDGSGVLIPIEKEVIYYYCDTCPLNSNIQGLNRCRNLGREGCQTALLLQRFGVEPIVLRVRRL
jgi:hypothetical protein